ncbi:hypothetical protein A2335_02085 [Candidatus Peregrinibacteria bacterium RIFOXYB2_FULL_32_7]|nr:MAG: hypothetical protein A2335_02085 [Candidatus Peregrinibacteria bacterium RIFOXYB2_FULL_32_7]
MNLAEVKKLVSETEFLQADVKQKFLSAVELMNEQTLVKFAESLNTYIQAQQRIMALPEEERVKHVQNFGSIMKDFFQKQSESMLIEAEKIDSEDDKGQVAKLDEELLNIS